MENEKFDLTGFKKQFNDVIEQNQKLEYIKKQYASLASKLVEFANTISDATEKIQKIALELDPVRTLKPRVASQSKKQYMEELNNIMIGGTQITRNYLIKTYPNLCIKECAYMLNMLQKFPNVKKTKDGKTIRLYI